MGKINAVQHLLHGGQSHNSTAATAVAATYLLLSLALLLQHLAIVKNATNICFISFPKKKKKIPDRDALIFYVLGIFCCLTYVFLPYSKYYLHIYVQYCNFVFAFCNAVNCNLNFLLLLFFGWQGIFICAFHL